MTEREYAHLRRIERVADALHFKIMLYGKSGQYAKMAVLASEIRGELNRLLNGAVDPLDSKWLTASTN